MPVPPPRPYRPLEMRRRVPVPPPPPRPSNMEALCANSGFRFRCLITQLRWVDGKRAPLGMASRRRGGRSAPLPWTVALSRNAKKALLGKRVVKTGRYYYDEDSKRSVYH